MAYGESQPQPLTLLLDLDGTVCRSDEPVLDYARRVTRALPTDARDAFLAALVGFLDDSAHQRATPPLAAVLDGYQAVEALAASYSVPRAEVDAAYLASREGLRSADHLTPVSDATRELLVEVRERAKVVLVTNAPEVGVGPLLARLGVAAYVDEVITGANKPGGLVAIVDRFLTESGASHEPWRLLSVGDVWPNDLAGPYARGCATAYVDRFGRPRAEAHASGARLEHLLGFIREWSTQPALSDTSA